MPITEALRTELTAAMRRRDKPATAALRATLGDLANAEAIASNHPATSTLGSEHVAGALVGLGAAEAPRREVPDEEQRRIVAAHQAELGAHAERLTALCRHEEADAARRSADVLGRVLAGAEPDRG